VGCFSASLVAGGLKHQTAESRLNIKARVNGKVGRQHPPLPSLTAARKRSFSLLSACASIALPIIAYRAFISVRSPASAALSARFAALERASMSRRTLRPRCTAWIFVAAA
jgi:hypothetical protein